MPQNLTNFTSLLKVFYLPRIRAWMDKSTVLLANLNRNRESVVGKSFTIAIQDGYNEGMGAIGETSTLYTARNVQSRTVIVPSKYWEGSVQLTRVLMKASRSSVGAYAKALNLEMKSMLWGAKKDVNRMLFGDGTGVLAYSTQTDDVSPFTVDDGAGNSFHYARKDMLVEVLDAAAAYVKLCGDTGIRLTSVTSSTITATGGVDSLSGADDGDLWVKKGTNDSTTGVAPTNWFEMMGLAGIVSASDPPVGSLQGLARSGNADWQCGGGNTVNVNSDDISDDYIQQAFDIVEANDADVNLIITTRGVRRQLMNHFHADRRFVNTMTLNGGFKAIDYNGVPIVVDNDCQKQTMYVLDTSSLAIYVLDEWDWMDEDGSQLHRTGTTMAYDATLCYYAELGVDNCKKQTKLTSINE